MSIRTVIVDNDKELLDKLSGILKEMGQIDLVGCFEHPADVLKAAEREPVDLVFSDVVMPDISGITLAARLSELAAPPRVVLLSDIPGLSIKAWNIKAFAFIPKPYTKGDIAEIVKQYEHLAPVPV